jgi:hypothetical protein
MLLQKIQLLMHCIDVVGPGLANNFNDTVKYSKSLWLQEVQLFSLFGHSANLAVLANSAI